MNLLIEKQTFLVTGAGRGLPACPERCTPAATPWRIARDCARR